MADSHQSSNSNLSSQAAPTANRRPVIWRPFEHLINTDSDDTSRNTAPSPANEIREIHNSLTEIPDSVHNTSTSRRLQECVHRQKRSKFSDKQLKVLNDTFQKRTYLCLQERHDISLRLRLSEDQVKNWFQNKRMKTKREYIQAVGRGLLIPLENPELPRFSRMPKDYFVSTPVPQPKYLILNNR